MGHFNLDVTIWINGYVSIFIGDTFSIAIVCVLLSSKLPVSFLQLREGEESTIVSLVILLGVMLIVEGLLISKNAVGYSTPRIRKGSVD